METEEVRAAIIEFLATECGLDTTSVEDDSELFSSNTLSSLNLLNLIVFLEERFGVTITPLEAGVENLDTITKIVGFTQAKIAEI